KSSTREYDFSIFLSLHRVTTLLISVRNCQYLCKFNDGKPRTSTGGGRRVHFGLAFRELPSVAMEYAKARSIYIVIRGGVEATAGRGGININIIALIALDRATGMVWYGMVWYGIVWCGVARRAQETPHDASVIVIAHTTTCGSEAWTKVRERHTTSWSRHLLLPLLLLCCRRRCCCCCCCCCVVTDITVTSTTRTGGFSERAKEMATTRHDDDDEDDDDDDDDDDEDDDDEDEDEDDDD
ncbi:hypothetical protein V1477_006002, partial [Vespula maculifrons]